MPKHLFRNAMPEYNRETNGVEGAEPDEFPALCLSSASCREEPDGGIARDAF
jgi:hypothetical protein